MFVHIIKVFIYSDLPQATINKAVNDLRKSAERTLFVHFAHIM